MKKLFISGIMLLMCQLMFGGVVKEISGSVDVLIDGKWQKAALNMEIKDGTKIMTGLKSSVKVETKGGYYIVKELSLATFNELSTDKSYDQKISLDMGRVRVRFEKIKDVKSTFRVQTPRGTASVRGTEKEIGYNSFSGMDVLVIKGFIDIFDNSGNNLTAGEGQEGGVDENGNLNGNANYIDNKLGIGNEYGDDDYNSESIRDALKSLFEDYYPEWKIQEPERL